MGPDSDDGRVAWGDETSEAQSSLEFVPFKRHDTMRPTWTPSARVSPPEMVGTGVTGNAWQVSARGEVIDQLRMMHANELGQPGDSLAPQRRHSDQHAQLVLPDRLHEAVVAQAGQGLEQVRSLAQGFVVAGA